MNANETKVMEFLKENPKSSVDVIAKDTGVFKLNVHKAVKSLAKQLVSEKNGTVIVYSSKSSTAAKPADATDSKSEFSFSGKRDTSKLLFQGVKYGKGKFLLALVQNYCQKNPKTNLDKLKAIFKDEYVRPYGTIQELSKAKKMSVDRERFFMSPGQVIKVGGKTIVVSNQVGSGNIGHFLSVARSLGYLVKKV